MVQAAVSNTLRYDPERCINCGMCTMVCPHGVFAAGERAVALADAEACMECGACQRNCPTEAIRVDSGVGCATAMIQAALRGRPLSEASCGDASCSGDVGECIVPDGNGGDGPAECG